VRDPVDARAAQLIDQIRSGDWATIERGNLAERMAWWEGRAQPSHPTPRAGYEAFVLGSLGVADDQVAIRSENDSAIFWERRDPCATLAASESLGLGTRFVCRRVCEKPAQAFLSHIDPRLRFVRDYVRLRPRGSGCREGIVRVDLEAFMGMALEEAHASRAGGDKGYGAVVAFGGDVLARAHDTGVTDRDPSLHAEVGAIRAAVQTIGSPDLCGAVLVSTSEPCPMCSSLAVWANVTSIVFGASIEQTARLGRSRIRVGADEIVSRGPAIVEVIGGVREAECLALYR
jgi:tRNA(adenine34) deaminase